MKEWAVKTGIAVLMIVMVGLVVYGLYRKVSVQRTVYPRVMKDLLVPYCALLAGGGYEEAYGRYTSKDFRKRYSLREYVAAQEKNREEYGDVRTIKPNVESLDPVTEIGRRSFYYALYRYTGTKNFTYIAIDIVEEDGAFKIDRTYEHSIPLDMNRERLY